MEALRFTIPEILSLLGIAQCLYIITYMVFRSGNLLRATLPLLYFIVLGLAFAFDFVAVPFGKMPYYEDITWMLWFSGPPLSVLLIIQIAQISKLPDLKHYWVLILIPLSYSFSCLFDERVDDFHDLLIVSGLVSGGISLMTIWLNRSVLETITVQKTGKTRYWLILSLIVMNSAFLGLMLMSVSFKIPDLNTDIIRTIMGLGFVYLINTSLFRIYPQAIMLTQKGSPNKLNEEEYKIALKIQDLLDLDKIYHEATYSRADLARECGLSEASVSRIINVYFQKSFPQLMNERRIEDAKRLLRQTDAPIKTVAEEVGFNALASFNRVFKDMTGKNPGEYRGK